MNKQLLYKSQTQKRHINLYFNLVLLNVSLRKNSSKKAYLRISNCCTHHKQKKTHINLYFHLVLLNVSLHKNYLKDYKLPI